MGNVLVWIVWFAAAGGCLASGVAVVSLTNPFVATRYHSLAIVRKTVPAELEVSAWSEDGEIMGVRHREHPVEGVQFHPESILTVEGKRLLGNFLKK